MNCNGIILVDLHIINMEKRHKYDIRLCHNKQVIGHIWLKLNEADIFSFGDTHNSNCYASVLE